MIRILNSEPDNYSNQARAILNGLGELHEEACDRRRLIELIPVIDILLVRLGHRVDAELLNHAERLRAIVTATTGLTHIDVEAARQRDIRILCLKGERGFLDRLTATAELTWALLLGLIRRLPAAHQHVMDGGWDRDQFRGYQLAGKTLGIIGFGRLGTILADYGRAFRMQVLACDPHVKVVPEWVRRVGQTELLESSDVVSLHVHLDPTTHHMLDRSAFARMRYGAILLNTSRGELVEEAAMLEALESGCLAGAGLDVLEGEVAKHPDWPRNSSVWRYARTHDNLLLVPHIGGVTQESMAETEIFMANKLKRFLQGDS